MHTSRALSSDDFQIRVDGGQATVEDLLPGFDEHARLGIVVTQAEEILRAINDRGVTHLLVPEGATAGPLERDTRHSARRRIRTAIAYSPDGRVENPDVEITAAAPAEQFVIAMLGHPRDIAGVDGRPRETFRRLPLDDALEMLETGPQPPAQ
jgi:hypothetical protein